MYWQLMRGTKMWCFFCNCEWLQTQCVIVLRIFTFAIGFGKCICLGRSS